MRAKIAHNILLTVACAAFWCLGVALLGQDPLGLDWLGLIGGVGGLVIFFTLHNIARGGGRDEIKETLDLVSPDSRK